MPLFTSLPLTLLSALSSYGLYFSYHNVTRLQQYESTTEKAAQWSSTAARRLHKTRTTQTSGTVALFMSLLSAVVLGLGNFQGRTLVNAALINSGSLYLSHLYMGAFWNEREQTQVPFVEKFNEAIKGSEKVVDVLGWLCGAWGAAAVLWLVA